MDRRLEARFNVPKRSLILSDREERMPTDKKVRQTEAEPQDVAGTDEQIAPSISAAVGETLRAWRQEAGLSIREVAERSGLSVSFVSLVERGKTEIAVVRLIRLADVFGRQIPDVLASVYGGERENGTVSEASGRKWGRAYSLTEGVGMVYLGRPEWATQPFIVSLEPGGVHGPVMHSHREVIMCLDGEGTIATSDTRAVLAPGDILDLEPNTYHAYLNSSSSTCQLLAIDFRSDDVRILLDTWDQIERSKRSGDGAQAGLDLLQDATSDGQDLTTGK
jgi:transcriptional regulator with XRE-family HTH domain/uncharacterized cupin superfamily protein